MAKQNVAKDNKAGDPPRLNEKIALNSDVKKTNRCRAKMVAEILVIIKFSSCLHKCPTKYLTYWNL